jgi:transcriptional regulator with XRE-family HTH domain
VDHEADVGAYAKAVGSHLRAARTERHMSLQMVATLSGQEFRTSVLGAYERGDRVISLPRLERLAHLYGVPLERFLPGDRVSGQAELLGGRTTPDGRPSRERAGSGVSDKKVTIDLIRLKSIKGPERDVLEPYLLAIQAKRRSFQGPMITIRAEDMRVIASLVGVTPQDMSVRLDQLGLSPRPAEHQSTRSRRAS